MPRNLRRKGSQSAWHKILRNVIIYIIQLSCSSNHALLNGTQMNKFVLTSAGWNYHQLHVEAFSCVDGFPSTDHTKKDAAPISFASNPHECWQNTKSMMLLKIQYLGEVNFSQSKDSKRLEELSRSFFQREYYASLETIQFIEQHFISIYQQRGEQGNCRKIPCNTYLEWLICARDNGFPSQHHETGYIICVILYKEVSYSSHE